MPRQTIASLVLQLEQREHEAVALQLEINKQRAQLVQQEAALRLMRMIIGDALTTPEARSDAALGR